MTDGKCENYKYCYMLCLNTHSNYCLPESCPPHYEYNSTGFRCERKIQNQNTRSLKSIIVESLWSLNFVNSSSHLFTFKYISEDEISGD
ncbi:hypothetical protein J1N35_019431 [Gossypium stocksii]|uniref:Uncharacterized protein n=1 Tax=Gossypium stocksii TaxID=47602 RepID=A0A9D3VQX8_9ROSI|nr:hypothetical protein J1N35_019431 [Gossypium stocksii]